MNVVTRARPQWSSNIPYGSLDLTLILIAQSQVQQLGSQLILGGVGDGDAGALAVVALGAPIVLDEVAQDGQGGLADVRRDGRVCGDVGQRQREDGVRLRVLELDLCLLPRPLGSQLGVCQQLHQLILHCVRARARKLSLGSCFACLRSGSLKAVFICFSSITRANRRGKAIG